MYLTSTQTLVIYLLRYFYLIFFIYLYLLYPQLSQLLSGLSQVICDLRPAIATVISRQNTRCPCLSCPCPCHPWKAPCRLTGAFHAQPQCMDLPSSHRHHAIHLHQMLTNHSCPTHLLVHRQHVLLNCRFPPTVIPHACRL